MDWRDIAHGQAGVISRAQLLESDITQGSLRGLIKRRDLIVEMPGVYSVRAAPDSFIRRAWAASLWSAGVISHRSAAQLLDLPSRGSPAIHVTVGRPLHKAAPNVRLHRTGSVLECINLDGLRITSRSSTVVDLLRSEPYRAARDLFDRAVQLGWVNLAGLADAVELGRGRAGNAQLRRLVQGAEPGAHAESERVLRKILRRGGFTGWQAQYRIRVATGFAYVDVAFPQQRLAIEVDGRRYHDANSGRFESDRYRQNDLHAQGWRVLRFTWRMLTEDPADVIAQIARILAISSTPDA